MTSNSKKYYFRVDARTILQLGRQSIKDHITALIELVKNAYDADAGRVEIDLQSRKGVLRVTDDGSGMDEDTFHKTWLRIGYSAKRRATKSPSGRRRVVGEKGVGRISADRLGGELELRTLARGKTPFSAVVSWDAFDVDDRDLGQVPVLLRQGVTPDLPKKEEAVSSDRPSGTELIVRNLRQAWHASDIENLVQELETLVSPFDQDGDFAVWLKTDIAQAFEGEIQSSLPEQAELELRAKLFRNVITYELIDRAPGRAKPLRRSGKLKWADVGTGPDSGRQGTRTRSARTGPVELRLYYFPQRFFREHASVLKASELRDRTVGIRIYRDKVRVRPYGDSRDAAGDWLSLAARKAREPAGVSRTAYRIPPTELAGAVFIGRDRNRKLYDSAGREGLVHNEAFADLRALVLRCLRIMEGHRHKVHTDRAPVRDVIPALQAVESFSTRLGSIEKEWRTIQAEAITNPRRALDRAGEIILSSIDTVKSTRESVSALVDQTRLFRGLSSLGIAASVFGHETQVLISLCLGNLAEAGDELRSAQPDLKLACAAIDEALVNARKVSAWGAFAVARVKPDKRRPKLLRIDTLVQKLAEELRPAYTAIRTPLEVNVEPVELKAHAMDIEAIALNLLTNAYSFSQEGKRRGVRVTVKYDSRDGRKGAVIVVADSGPGVAAEAREVVWEPLYTTKRDAAGNESGTGLGLSIIDSIVQDRKGSRSLDSDPDLKGARFTIWLPIS
ncbi:MAG: hypothetical protein JWO05_1067 [Gemmatimonadetes bacterium]|nr:hypothetical protein [Gemmatimonadota bacterium]